MPETKREELPKVDLTTAPEGEARRRALLDLFPEAVDETGKIDQGKLSEFLGDLAGGDKERYNLAWAGKRDAQRSLQIPSSGSLVPVREESVDFDATENVIIEGDNLEVLKLLQKSYHGKVKMIYIDPPYNTGNDFIYPDNFREGLQSYLEFTGQAKKRVSETEENLNRAGRVHSNWLNMMYPRLALARNLLREDGVIFVSIDDHEVHNLRLLMDEVFGEENLIAELVWKSRQNKDNRTVTGASIDHEYVLAYGQRVRGSKRDASQYSNPDGDSRGDWTSANMVGLLDETRRPNCHYDLKNPETGITYPKPRLGWRYDPQTMDRLIAEKRIIWPASATGRPRRKVFLPELKAEFTGFSSVIGVDIYTRDGTAEIEALFGKRVMEFPKPTGLIRELIEQGAEEQDAIVVDFFAGSGTTAQAVAETNAEDGGSRTFVLVQLPEKLVNPIALDDGTELNTIADITRERVRRAAKNVAAKGEGKLDFEQANPDLGFRSFRLSPSNFHPWADTSEGDPEMLADLLRQHANNLVDGAGKEAVLFEILLKSGYELSTAVGRLKVRGAKDTFAVEGGRLLVCLDDPVKEETLYSLIEQNPEKIVCLDHAFGNNDALKANIAQQVKQHNALHPDAPLDFRTV